MDNCFSSVGEFNTGFSVFAPGSYTPMTETLVETNKDMIAFHLWPISLSMWLHLKRNWPKR